MPQPRSLHALDEALPATEHHHPCEDKFDALLAARQRVCTGEYAAIFAKRAGCEGTLSREVRRCRLRRGRSIGQARTHLGHVLTAVGLNFVRLGEWVAGIPRAKARSSPFATLMTSSARA